MITEVKHKLIYKAIDKYNLLNSHMRSDSDGAPTAPQTPEASAPTSPDTTENLPNQEEYIK